MELVIRPHRRKLPANEPDAKAILPEPRCLKNQIPTSLNELTTIAVAIWSVFLDGRGRLAICWMRDSKNSSTIFYGDASKGCTITAAIPQRSYAPRTKIFSDRNKNPQKRFRCNARKFDHAPGSNHQDWLICRN